MYERHRARTYVCDLCGTRATVMAERRGFSAPGYYLPEGWVGSHRKNGVCLCPLCAEAYRDALLANRGLSEAPSGDPATEGPETGGAGARGAEGVPEGETDGR